MMVYMYHVLFLKINRFVKNLSFGLFLPGNEFSYWPLAKEAVEGNADRNALDVNYLIARL